MARKLQQILSNTEENILARWITRFTIIGYPASPKLVLKMAEEIHREHIFLMPQATSGSLKFRPINYNWLTHFKQRNPEITSIWTKQITNFHFKAATQKVIKLWFDAVTEKHLKHDYPPKHHYNMDELKFAIGTSQSSKALINVHKKSNWKMIQNKQE